MTNWAIKKKDVDRVRMTPVSGKGTNYLVS